MRLLEWPVFPVLVRAIAVSAQSKNLSPSNGHPPEAWEPLLHLVRLARRPLDRFLRIQAASGVLLIVAAATALFWANSRWATDYFALWATPVGVRVGDFGFERTLAWCVNDGLMVVFFFVVGLEIRREIHHGELSQVRRALLPLAAALGGMAVPACVYLLMGQTPLSHRGWGVPMATDIAFALGVLALLGNRVPPALRVLLLALAVIDDLGAIVVIAVFYSAAVVWHGLGIAFGGLVGIYAMQRLGVRAKVAYVVPTVVVWGGIYASGVHPTIAGVIVGLITPVRAWLGPEGFVSSVRQDIDALVREGTAQLSSHELSATLHHVDIARREAMSPAESLIETLHPWVAFAIMPVFAFANAGVALGDGALDTQALRVVLGSALGLFVGKPLGVCLACLIAVKLRMSALPQGITSRHVLVLGVVAGVGFTMSLFIAQLAFGDALLLGAAKRGVMLGSLAAAVVALLLGRLVLKSEMTPGAATTADEAEASTLQ